MFYKTHTGQNFVNKVSAHTNRSFTITDKTSRQNRLLAIFVAQLSEITIRIEQSD